MHLILLFISSLTLIVLISSVFVFLFNKKIGFFVPLSIIIIFLTYYSIGILFNSFYFVKFIFLIYAIVGIIFIFKIINKKTHNLIFTNGLLLFIFIYIFVFVYCYKYNIAYFDEFYHWAPMVKSMFINNKLYSVCGAAGGAHPEYPPFFSIIELFYCQLYGSFSECVSSIGAHIVALSFVTVPYVDVFDLKKIKSTIFFLFCFSITILFGTVGYFRSILIDIPLGFIASFPLILIFSNVSNTKYGTIYYGISLGCLLLVKQLGLIFYIFNILLYIIVYCNESFSKQFIKNLIIIISISAFIYIPWMLHIYCLGIGMKGQFSIVTIFSKLFSFTLNQEQISTLSRMFKATMVGNMLNGKVYMSCAIFYLIIIGMYIIVSYIKKISVKKYILFDIISIILFFISLSIIYCFSMEENEMLSLNNYFRYVVSFNIYITFLFVISIRKNIDSIFAIVAIVILFIINIPNYKLIIPRVFIQGRVNDELIDEEINAANYIITYLNEKSNYLIVSDSNFPEYKYKYLTDYKRKITKSKYYDEYSLYEVKYDINELINEIKQFDYVIFSIEHDDIFYQLENELKLYTNCNGVYNYIVYEINKDYNVDSDVLLYMLT